MAQHADQLMRLGELSDYKVADGDPDPRGWEVVTQNGDRIGRVDDLIVDRAAKRAEFLEVRLEHEADRHVLIPTAAVDVGPPQQQSRQVAVGASLDYLSGVTPYKGLPLTMEQEAEYRSCPPASTSRLDRPATRIRQGDGSHG